MAVTSASPMERCRRRPSRKASGALSPGFARFSVRSVGSLDPTGRGAGLKTRRHVPGGSQSSEVRTQKSEVRSQKERPKPQAKFLHVQFFGFLRPVHDE